MILRNCTKDWGQPLFPWRQLRCTACNQRLTVIVACHVNGYGRGDANRHGLTQPLASESQQLETRMKECRSQLPHPAAETIFDVMGGSGSLWNGLRRR